MYNFKEVAPKYVPNQSQKDRKIFLHILDTYGYSSPWPFVFEKGWKGDWFVNVDPPITEKNVEKAAAKMAEIVLGNQSWEFVLKCHNC